jgi:hypothetical protein
VNTTTETRADRIRRRFADHKIGALVVVGLAILGTVGGAVGGVREIVDLFDGSSQGTTTTTAVQLEPSELRTAKNSRYGFSFQYPVTWTRQDPINGDGLTAIGPEPGLELIAYGGLPVGGPSPADTFNRLDYLVRQLADETGQRVIEEPNQQNVTRFLRDGGTTELAGSRVVIERDAGEARPAQTSVALVTTTPDRDVTMLCNVPTSLYSTYRGACNQLLSTLTLTR